MHSVAGRNMNLFVAMSLLCAAAVEGFDDPSMGWARYAQYFKHFNLNR